MDTSVRWTPLIIKVLLATCASLSYLQYCTWLDAAQIASISSTIANIAGTLLGFLITAMTLLAAVMDRQLVVAMKVSGHYQRLMKETFHTCALLLATVLSGILVLFISSDSLSGAFFILVFFSSLSFLFVCEAGYRFRNVFITMT